MAPSRQFMIQQAVLNAALLEPDARHIKALGVADFLSCCVNGSFVRPNLCKNIRDQFRAIAARYGA